MDKHGFIATIFILLIVSNTSNASLMFNLRRLISGATDNTSTNLQVSPVGSPVSGPVNVGKPEKDKHKESEVSNQNNTSSTVDSKGSKKNDDDDINNNKNNTGSSSPPDGVKKGVVDDKGKGENIAKSQLGSNDNCEGSQRSCRDKMMLASACIFTSKNGSKGLFILVQNKGESNLKVHVNFPNSKESGFPDFELPKNQIKKIDISSNLGKSSKIILSSGNGNCVFELDSSVSVENFLRQFSSYSRQVTPIYVVYFFLLALLCGGTWACCKLNKRSRHDGIPYQELEMGLPESTSAVNVETAEGWDQDWDDDDWDEENAVKSPGGHNMRSISANGLTSRSSKKDGWDNEWDD